jgi:hypothetical protein
LQGDRIGQILAYWAVVYFGQFFKQQKQHKFLGYFFHGKLHVLNLTKYGLGYVLGVFSNATSGHPEWLSPLPETACWSALRQAQSPAATP